MIIKKYFKNLLKLQKIIINFFFDWMSLIYTTIEEFM